MDVVRVQETRPILDITVHRAKLHITNNIPRMRIRTQRPVMKVNRKGATFKISRAEVRRQVNKQLNASGKTHISPEHRARAEQRALQALSRLSVNEQSMVSQAGDSLPVIVAEAVASVSQSSMEDLTQPQASPSIEWDTGHISIEWSDYVLEIDWDDIDGPQIEVEPYSIEVNIRNQPVVRFKMNPKKMAKTVGANIDAKI